MQGQLEVFTQQRFGVVLHDNKDGYTSQQGDDHQNYSRDQNNLRLMHFWMWHVFRSLSVLRNQGGLKSEVQQLMVAWRNEPGP